MVSEEVLSPSIPCPVGTTGVGFLDTTRSLSRVAREEAIYEAIAGGAVPSFAHSFVEVQLVRGEHIGVVQVAIDSF
mgnify:CR=1 FL=1